MLLALGQFVSRVCSTIKKKKSKQQKKPFGYSNLKNVYKTHLAIHQTKKLFCSVFSEEKLLVHVNERTKSIQYSPVVKSNNSQSNLSVAILSVFSLSVTAERIFSFLLFLQGINTGIYYIFQAYTVGGVYCRYISSWVRTVLRHRKQL